MDENPTTTAAATPTDTRIGTATAARNWQGPARTTSPRGQALHYTFTPTPATATADTAAASAASVRLRVSLAPRELPLSSHGPRCGAMSEMRAFHCQAGRVLSVYVLDYIDPWTPRACHDVGNGYAIAECRASKLLSVQAWHPASETGPGTDKKKDKRARDSDRGQSKQQLVTTTFFCLGLLIHWRTSTPESAVAGAIVRNVE